MVALYAVLACLLGAILGRINIPVYWRLLNNGEATVREDAFATHDYASIALEFEDGRDLTWYWSAALRARHADRPRLAPGGPAGRSSGGRPAARQPGAARVSRTQTAPSLSEGG